MLIGFLILLGGAALLYVAWPFWRGPAREEDASPSAGDLRELLARKETLLASVRELDFDLETGKLSAGDHGELRDRCRAEALGVMERLEEFSSSRRDQAQAREGRKGHPPEAARFCAQCGRPARPAERFCPRCGSRLGAWS